MTVANPTYKIVVTQSRSTGQTRDDVMNTYHFEGLASPTGPDFDNWVNRWHNLYWVTHGAAKLADYIAPVFALTASAVRIQFYRIPTEPNNLGSPVYTTYSTHTGPWQITGALPSEVAACLTLKSFVGTSIPEEGPGNTRPASRRRNRIYFGPLNGAAGTGQGGTNEAILSTGFINTLLDSYNAEMIGGAATEGWHNVTFSKASWSTSPVQVVQVDNAFDTQRRRGNRPNQTFTRP